MMDTNRSGVATTEQHGDVLRVRVTNEVASFDEAARVYATYGACIVQGLLPTEVLDGVRHEIRRLIELASERIGRPVHAGSFDADFQGLCAEDPGAQDAIFGAARRLASVHELSVHPRLMGLSRHLMHTDMVMVPPYKPVRIDWQPRAGALLPWHQDYPYAQDSLDGVVYWVPLMDVDENNGCLGVIPGSHAGGVRPVRMVVSDKHDIKGLELADRVHDESRAVSLPMRTGEVLVLSALLVHRSQQNHTERARWTVQVRHGNFAHPTAVQKRWPRGHYERHWFDESHPEDVVSAKEST
jgi:ectoine hydroxylase-related dioxygenase (phytanoyl-CoA dioxygenase family)